MGKRSVSVAAYQQKIASATERAAPVFLLDGAAAEFKSRVEVELSKHECVILPPMEVEHSFDLIEQLDMPVDTVMLDPWYNKGIGGVVEGYLHFYLQIIQRSGQIAQHVFFWGFPEIVAPFVERIPEPLKLTCWLTWYYKNNPSVIRGWRSSQNACLHMSREGAVLHPQRFLNEKQLELLDAKKLRYMPGPTSVIEGQPDDVLEEPLLVGFVGRREQTGHPSQKPFRVYDDLLKMSVSNDGLVFDPMAGSGTTGAVAQKRRYRAILGDRSEDYISLMESRLQLKRLQIADLVR